MWVSREWLIMVGTLSDSPEALNLISLSRVRLFVTPWTVAQKAPPYMGFFRQEYWSGLPFPSPGDLPDPGSGPPSFMPPALTGRDIILYH